VRNHKERSMTTTHDASTNSRSDGAGAEPLPAPSDYQPTDLRFIAEPTPVLREMREQARLHYHDVHLGHRVILTHYDDVDAALRSKAAFKDVRKLPVDDPRRVGALPTENARADAAASILSLDQPEHNRLRRLVNRAFTPRSVEALNPRIAALADELLDAVEGEDEIDFMQALAIPLPVIVISEMLGVDPQDRGHFKQWSLTSVNSDLNPGDHERVRAGRAARESMRGYFDRVVTERRANPSDDLVSALVLAEDEGDRLTHDETLTMLGLLLAAGNLTTTDLLGNGMLTLLSHPDQHELLRERPELMGHAVEEMLRYTPPVLNTSRMTSEIQELGGCPVAKHTTVIPSLMGANRDPKVFDDPERFDVTREKNPHLSFGGGIHFCLGSNLARNEARIVLERFLARYESVELIDPPEQAEWRGGGAFRGLLRLPLRVQARS
jgi:cytochrome P450